MSQNWTVASNGTGFFSVSCPSGKKVIGGGVEVDLSGLTISEAQNVQVAGSYPFNDTAWIGWVNNKNPFSLPAKTWAVCATTN